MGFFRQQRKRLQKNLRELFSFETIARGTLMTFTALTAIFNPLAPLTAHASNITDANGKSLLSKGKLHEIYAQGMNSAVGLNRFKNFELSKGEIANMHFNMEDSPETVDILVNLVNNKINIGGTLNAIRNNTIDGHLIFVTPDGLAVTQSGVINAGRFTGMVANPSHFRTLWGTDVSKFTKDFVLNNIDVNGNGDTKLYSNEKGIDIQGVINTRSGIALSGNSVKVGSDAKLIAKTNLDFTNLVNVDGVKSGITEGLKATKGDAGDIILSANCYKTEVTPFDKVIGGNPLQRTNKAQIDMDGLIDTDRDVKISATASQGVALSFIGTKLLPDIWSRISWAEANANIGGTIKAKNISVNANATTTYVDAFSLITPKLVVNKLFPSEGGLGTLKKVVNMVSKDLDLSWVYKVNSANVNIKKSADLNATNNLTLAAKADFSHDLTADLPGSSTKGINAIPLAAVTFGYYDNSAKINIDGKIEAGKDLKLTTDATTNVKQKATAKMKESTGVDSPDKGKTYVGLSIAVGNTTSEINLNRKDTINAGGNFTANATATPTIDVSSTSDLSFDDTGSIGTSFNFINDDSNVNVNVNSSINSGGKVDISAKQTISDTMAAENTLGKGDNYFAKANYNYEAWTNGYTFGEAIANRIKDKISGITYDQANNTKTAASEGFSSEAFMSLVDGSQFKAGSVGGYFGQIANTNVKIADNVKITAKNDVNINANTEITKLALSSVSSVYSANNAGKTDQPTERTVSIAATVSNIRNNAKVDMGGNITSSAGSVNVNSDSKMSYNPFVKQWENIKSNFNKMADSATALKKNFVSIFTGNEDSKKKIDKINQLLKDSEAKKSAENKMSEDEYNNFVNAIDALLNEYESVKNEPAKRQEVLNKLENLDKLFKDVNGQIDAYAKEKLQTNKALELKNQGNFLTRVADTVDSFVGTYNNAVKFGKAVLATVNPATYTNYYSRTESTAQNPVKADTSTYSGSVNVNILNNRSTVVGNNNLIVNADKNVSVNSKADTSTVTITGEGGMLGTLSKSYGKSMGLDVNYQNVNGNALVMLGEANIVGKNSVNIGSNNDLLQVSIMNGSSTAEGSNLHGMINVVTGNSNAVNLVNNSSNISAGKNLNVTANQKANAYDINGSLNLAKESSENNVGAGFTWLDIDSNSVANVVPFSTKANSDSLQKTVNADIKNNVKLASDMAKNAGATAPKATSKQGSLTGEIINVNADSAGNLLSIVAEGSYSTNSDSGLNKTVEGISKFGGIVSSGSKLLEKYLNAPADKLNKVVGNYINPSEKPPEMKPFTDPIQRTHAPVPTSKHLSSANAIAFRWGYSNSSAILDNLKINNSGDNSQLNLLAGDNSFRGAFSGSASANIFSGDKVNHASQKSFNSGVALNVGSNNVKSVLSNSTVDKTSLLTNVAQNSGSDVATGLSTGINSATGAGKQNAITLDISVNNSKNNVHALQINNTVNANNAALTNYAFNDKIQVAGGIGTHFSRGGQGGSNGSVSASYSDITNDLQSGIHGGKYSRLTAADVQAAKAQLQINSAIGLGRSSSSDNKSDEGSFTAAVAWQNNTTNAFINNADITATGKGNSPIFQITKAQDTDKYKAFHHYADRNATTEIFKNSDGSYYSRDYAKDTYVKSNNAYVKADDSSDGIRYIKVGDSYVQAAKDSNGYYTTKNYNGDIFVRFNDYNGGVNVLAYETKNNSSWNKYLTDRGFDLQGSDALADDAKSAANLPNLRSGSTNINFAVGVNSSANLAGSIGVAFDYDSDSLSSQLANNTISTPFINADTRRNLDNINVAAGVLHASDKNSWAGGGSFSVNILNNTNTVNLTDNKIKTDNFNSTVHNDANIVNVAGQGAWSGSAAVGAAAAVNSMNNTASSIINGGSFNRLTDNGSINLKTDVLNDTASTAIAATASKTSDGTAVNTSFAMNLGKNSTEAVVDKSKKSAVTIDNAKDISIKATDRNTKVTIGGTVDYTKGAASVGATYVHSGDTDEKLRAELNNATITTAGDLPNIDVIADDETGRTSIAASLGISRGNMSKLTFKGAGSNVYSDKEINALMKNTLIDANGKGNADVTIRAENQSKNLNMGGIMSAATSDFNVGLGAVWNRLRQNTVAEFAFDKPSNKTSTVGNFDMQALNYSSINSWAGGGTAAYQTLFDATGSFVSNYIGVKNGAGQVRSTINNANINSANNIGSVAQSDFLISNRAGSIAADFSMFGKGGSIVSVGATLAINDINEQTIAEANNSKLTAKAKDAANVIEVKDSVKDDAIVHNRILDKSLFRAGSLSESRIARNLRGVVVDATSTHAIADDVINVAAGARFDAAGIFNHNYISGATRASLNNTSVDGGKDVTVNAADWSNLGTFEIAAAASKSDAVGVAAGFIENGNTIDREITAETFGDFSAKSKDRKTINADNFSVTADSKNGIVNTALGVGFMWAQGATLGLGINAVSSDLKATTSANVANLNVNHTGDATIKADNLSRAYRSLGAGSVSISKGASGSFGFTVDILDQKSTVSANVDNSTLKGKNATVNATNYTDTDAWLGSVGIAVNTTDIHAPAVGGAGTFAFDYFNATTQVGIKNSTLEEDTLKATALNTSNFNDGSGAVAWGNWVGAGVNSVYNSINSKTTVDIEKSTLKTKTSSEISANDRRNVDTLVWNVSAGIVGLGVNTMLTYVNKNLSDDEDITAKVDKIINGLKEQQKNDKNISINKDRQHRDLNTWSIRKNATIKNAGVNVNVKNSTIDGGEVLKVEAMEQNRIHQDAFAATGGEASVGVGIARIIVKHAVGTNFADSNLSGNNVSINTGVGNFDIANPVNAQMQADRQSKLNGSNYVQRKLLTWKSSLINDTAKNTGLYNFDFTFGLAIGDAATYGLASGTVAVLPTTIKKFGTINADFVNTGITANNNLSINAADMTVTRSDNRAFSFATGGTVQVVNADSTNESDLAINFKGNKGGEIKANNIEVTTLNKVNQTVETDEHSASVFVNVPVEFTETKDTSRSAINVDKNYTFEGEKLLMSAANKPVLFADSLQNPYFAGTQLAYFGTLAKADSRAEINIGDGNAFNAGEVTFDAQIGEKETPTAKVDHSTVKILEVQGADFTSNAKAETNTRAKINVGNVEYDDSDVVINAENNAWRHVKTKSLQIIGVFEHGGGGSTNGISRGTDTAEVSAGGGTVNSLDINAAVTSYADNYAHSIAPLSVVEWANKSQARNYFGGHANAKLSGTWKSAGNISVNVSNEDGLDSMSEAGGVQVVGFEGMDFEVKIGKLNDSNELTGAANTGVTIADGTKIEATSFTVNATNTINTQKNKKYGANIDAWLTPVLGGAWAKSEENIKRTTSIDIGKNVDVTTTGEQIYEAGTQTQLDNTAIGITWGAIGGGRVTASTVGDFANTVKVGTGSKFTTTDTGDLTFATYDNILSNVYSQSNYKGAIGTDLVSNAVNKVTRKNTVDLAQGTTLNSANDLNLYAGATDEGHLSELISSTTSEASNGSLAISTSPQIDITADSTNELKINGDAKAKADLNLIADKGTENVTKRAVKYSFGEESDKGQIPVRRTVEDAKYFKYSNKNTSAIELNGAATAGDGNNVEVKISGSAARSDKPTYEVKFTDGNGKVLDGYKATTGSFNYAQTLAARWNELQELIGIYTAKTGNVTIAQYAGYVQELALLENKMARLGLLETKNGKKIPKTEGVNVNFVELPNISVSGGTVNITTPTLKGTGSIVANSNPYVGISNSSNAWLRVNDIATKNAGNGIIFNDAKIADNSKIGGVKFSLNDSKKSGITIDNSGASTKDNGVPNIEIAGLIDGSNRDVTIKNPNGDITVNASTNGKETGINGRTVNITSNGDLLHGYTSGTVHIGTAPEELYKKEVENGATRMGTVNNVDKGKGTYSDFKTGGSRIMGGTVLISADNINVSGLIQSGFDTYKVTITQAEVNAAIKAAEAKDKSKQVIIGDRQLYKVNTGGTTWNTDYKAQDYVVQVYYDPQTKTLVAEDINRAGGKVYLAGNIISTGNGAIKAADGGADITIENYSTLPLEIGKVLNNNVEGEINIFQVAGDKMSRYVYFQSTHPTQGATAFDDEIVSHSSNDAKTFKPTPETFYNWTVGNYITENQHREVLQRAWNESAARKLVNDDNFLRSISEGKNKTARFLGASFSRIEETSPLKSGTAVNVLKDAQKYDFKFGGDASVIDYKVLSRSFYRTERKLFKDNDYRIMWDEQLKYKGTYVASIRADYPIDIGFIGKKDGSITITGKGGVTLTDTIRNNSSGAKLSVNSSKDVTQKNGVDIYSNNANLEASGDLKGIKITALDEQKAVEFSAKTNGDINATITGKVNLGDVKAKNVADLTATGDITQSGGKTVKSNRIDLTSKNGAVTANVETGRQTVDDDPLSASLNVSAYGNIDITQKQNDLRIGKIKSTTGDVKIKAPSGRLIDALPGSSATLSSEDVDERIRKWVDTGLIAGADRNNAHVKSLERDVEAYETEARADFNYWQGIKDADRTKYTAAQNAVYDKYKKLFGSHSTVESYLAAQAADANSDYAKLKAEAANPTYKWTAEQLLYALDDAIVNRQTGSTDATEKLANITGKDVTITARSVGGVVKDTTITVEQLTGEDAIQYLKLLANANTANVEKILDDDGKTQAFVIKGNEPVGIHATGTVNITYDASTKTPPQNNNVALAVRKAEDNGSYSALNIGKINTIGAESTITILGKDGVKSVGANSILTAKSLFVEGGSGSIGTAENPLTVKLGDDGLTTARSEADIFIKSTAENPLALGALYTPKNATLTANGFVKNTINKLLAAAYLDVGGKLTLNAGTNDIGTAENPIRIKNNIDSVITVGKNVHLTGVNNPTNPTSLTNNFNLIAPETADTVNLVEALDAAKLATVANSGGMTELRSGGSVYLDLSNNKGYYFPSTKEIIWN